MHALLLPSFAAASLAAHDAHDVAPYMLDARRAEAEARLSPTQPRTLRHAIIRLQLAAASLRRAGEPLHSAR
jgi:hypothetical protein